MARKAESRLKERVRFSLRWKITLPFIFLALILGLGAAFLVNQLLNQTEEFQFLRQLADSGKQSNDAIVRIEEELLRVERLIANTEGVAQAVGLENAEELRARVLPLVINAGVDFAVILDINAISLLTIRHQPEGTAGDFEVLKGETFYQDWGFVEPILFGEIDELGDKQVGVGRTMIGEEETGVFAIGGPLRNNQNEVIGAALVGKPCRVYSSDVRVRVTETDLSTYPDASVVCGHLETDPDDPDAIANPTALVEVLSPSTEAHDRGAKWAHYRRLPSLREYILIAQDEPRIELYRRNEQGRWELYEARRSERVAVESLGIALDVDRVYENPLTS